MKHSAACLKNEETLKVNYECDVLRESFNHHHQLAGF